MAKVQDAFDDATPAISDDVAPEYDSTGSGAGERMGESNLVNREKHGQSLLSRSTEPLQRRSLFRR